MPKDKYHILACKVCPGQAEDTELKCDGNIGSRSCSAWLYGWFCPPYLKESKDNADILCQKLIDKYESGEWTDEPLLIDKVKRYLRRIAQRKKDSGIN